MSETRCTAGRLLMMMTLLSPSLRCQSTGRKTTPEIVNLYHFQWPRMMF